MKWLLNSIVVEYALNSMQGYIFIGRAYLSLWQHYRFQKWRYQPNGVPWTYKCEAKVRTQGLSCSYVVASCSEYARNVVYSDYSGKKQRQTVLRDFPGRKKDFTKWYRGNGKPYQHKELYDRIKARLGKIGSKANGVSHPIGYCAERNVANRLMLDRTANMDDIEFSLAIRPRTGEVVDYCGNCRALFGRL